MPVLWYSPSPHVGQGRCDACGSWNKIFEENSPPPITGRSRRRSLQAKPATFHALDQDYSPPARLVTGVGEFDSVVGGGLVAGSALLIGGDPGIGKSTLVLQIASRVARQNRVVYISGEEALDQIRDRALRIGLHASQLELANVMDVNAIVATLDNDKAPALVVIDSIQTLFLSEIDGSPGTVTQMRASAQLLIDLARGRSFSLILIGHVTKEGFIAGPKLLEHMVDVVLQFEGERNYHFRILRGLKNRFGRSHEIGVFEMTDCGLSEVSNPSRFFLSEDRQSVMGSAVFAGMEGSRPLLVEFQALAAPTGFSTPRRAVVGWDSNRLAMILAVVETHCSLSFSGYDVYLNVAGGLRVGEPAADMAAAAALLSAREGVPVPAQAVFFGENWAFGFYSTRWPSSSSLT